MIIYHTNLLRHIFQNEKKIKSLGEEKSFKKKKVIFQRRVKRVQANFDTILKRRKSEFNLIIRCCLVIFFIFYSYK